MIRRRPKSGYKKGYRPGRPNKVRGAVQIQAWNKGFRFYHGKPHKCGSTLRYVGSSNCVECAGGHPEQASEAEIMPGKPVKPKLDRAEPTIADSRPVCKGCPFRYTPCDDSGLCGTCRTLLGKRP